MKQVIKFKSPKEHYKADVCVVWCFDDRFTALLGELNKFGFKHADVIKLAGGVKSLVNPKTANFLIDNILASIRLHHTPLIILMAHLNCGAYGKVAKNKLLNDLKKARKKVEHLLKLHGFIPEVKAFFADFDGLWEVE